jgi:outer membrane protein TolC
MLWGCRTSREVGAGRAYVDLGISQENSPAAPVHAEVPLNLTALVSAARLHNPELVVLREAMEVARAEAMTVTGLRNPELRVEYSEGDRVTERTWYADGGRGSVPEWAPLGSYRDRVSESDGIRYTLRLYPPNPWLMRIQGAGSRARFAAAAADLQAAEWRIECEIGALLAQISGVQRELEIVRKQACLQRDYTMVVQSLIRHQEATVLDELGAEDRQMQAEDDAAILEAGLAEQFRQLSVLVGAPVQSLMAGEAPSGRGSPHRATPAMAETRRSQLVESRGEVMAAYWRHQDALAGWREARLSRVPWLTHLQASYAKADESERVDAAAGLSVNTAIAPPGRTVSADENTDEGWSVEAAIELPLFAWQSGATRIQQANVRRYAVALRECARQVQAEFDEAYRAWQAAVTRTDIARGRIITRRQKAVELKRSLEGENGLGPEARFKVEEMLLRLQQAEVNADREEDMAWWRLQQSSGATHGAD